jgi:predicted PurR-regulated permease PerM
MAEPPAPPAPPRPIAMATAFVLAGCAAVAMLWFLSQAVAAILLLFFAMVVAIALSAPVGWFMRRGLSRRWAAALTLLIFLATILLLAALVIPRLIGQVVALTNEVPHLVGRIQAQGQALIERYPDLAPYVNARGAFSGAAPSAVELFRGLGGVSLSLLGFLALLIVFFSIVGYILLDPRPIVRAYRASLPIAYRDAGMRALRRSAHAVIGWSKASLAVGAIQAILVMIFLSLMHVPGALVWAALAFFADFIPRIGGYIMAFPPVILALAIGPMTAVWVVLFYIISGEILGSIVAPKIRGTTMQLHPVLIIFFTLAFALAFGLLGAIVATPAAAFFSAYYSEFYLRRPV